LDARYRHVTGLRLIHQVPEIMHCVMLREGAEKEEDYTLRRFPDGSWMVVDDLTQGLAIGDERMGWNSDRTFSKNSEFGQWLEVRLPQAMRRKRLTGRLRRASNDVVYGDAAEAIGARRARFRLEHDSLRYRLFMRQVHKDEKRKTAA